MYDVHIFVYLLNVFCRFIKKEKEIASTQFDVVQSENVRLNLKLEQVTNELNEAKAELKEVLSNFQVIKIPLQLD